jgi:hypothetical protein
MSNKDFVTTQNFYFMYLKTVVSEKIITKVSVECFNNNWNLQFFYTPNLLPLVVLKYRPGIYVSMYLEIFVGTTSSKKA